MEAQNSYSKLSCLKFEPSFEELVGGEAGSFKAVTNRYPVYAKIGKHHQYCLAHIIRDFRRHAERDGPDSKIREALTYEFTRVCGIHKDYRRGEISLKKRNIRIGHRKRQIEFWLTDGFANGSDRLSGLSNNLLDNFNKLWTFTKVQGMEPTNNIAEYHLN